MRTAAPFSHTVRSGVRNGRPNVVLYVVSTLPDESSQIGFIVSKAIGNAVTRNLVKRRLREIAVETVRRHPYGVNVVVRALPAAATASWGELVNDYQKAFSKVVPRLSVQPVGPTAVADGPNTTVDQERGIEGENVCDPSEA